MAIVRRRLSDLPPLTPEEIARRKALAERLEREPPHPEAVEWTDEQWARSVRVKDFPSLKEAEDEARCLADMQKAGMGVEELEAYKKSRIGRFAAV